MGCLSIFGIIFGFIGSIIGIVVGVVGGVLGGVLGGVGILVGVLVPIIVLLVPALVLLGVLWFFVQVFKQPDEEKRRQASHRRPNTPPHREEPVQGEVVDVEEFEEFTDPQQQSDKDNPQS